MTVGFPWNYFQELQYCKGNFSPLNWWYRNRPSAWWREPWEAADFDGTRLGVEQCQSCFTTCCQVTVQTLPPKFFRPLHSHYSGAGQHSLFLESLLQQIHNWVFCLKPYSTSNHNNQISLWLKNFTDFKKKKTKKLYGFQLLKDKIQGCLGRSVDCLQLKSWTQGSGIKSHIEPPVHWEVWFSLCASHCLCSLSLK